MTIRTDRTTVSHDDPGGLLLDRERFGFGLCAEFLHGVNQAGISSIHQDLGDVHQAECHPNAPDVIATTVRLALDEVRAVADALSEIESIRIAARRAEDAGFDGVEVHGANGYLLDSFLTEYTNDRDDEYGGSPENRVRFPAEVVRAVREATPEGFIVGIRISQSKVNDPDYRWSGEDEAEVVFGTLSAAGVDYLHVTEAAITTPAFDSESGPTLSELAARYGDVPVIANGGLTDPELAREVLETGGADLLTLATGALANPDWPQRVEEDRELDAFDLEATLQPDASINEFELPE